MHPIDYEVYHHYTSTHPKSPFTGRLVVMRIEPGVSRKLLGRELTVEKPDGSSETTTVVYGPNSSAAGTGRPRW